MNTESLLAEERTALDSVLLGIEGLDERHVAEFRQVMFRKPLNKKDFLITEGTTCNFIGIVVSGIMRSFIRAGESDEFNNDFYFERDFVSAYTSFLTSLPTNCNIQALTDVNLVYITSEQYQALVSRDNEWLKLGKYIAETFFIRKCKRETSFLKHSAAQRLESVLQLYPGIEQRVSQYHIASYLGVKPESLSRIKLLTYINK
ncbi:Crp/Fnr family transcriptional regulator [Mucilaginibacter lappiensis]|uniref:CRP-like cAMP-binding protein n=1 Tax=Mucilaginibacter lappiensis TaxID=354630 RepID=A0A841JQP1_9SPHI|nr:Crp/Fnr family transcriptional regulator [Mucilaginibacter lappiensis]MBB6130615.1 CRP-like cAMP-binding protein [Mucilaginibacter lappiensis]